MTKPYEITFFWSKKFTRHKVMNLASSAFLLHHRIIFVKVGQFVSRGRQNDVWQWSIVLIGASIATLWLFFISMMTRMHVRFLVLSRSLVSVSSAACANACYLFNGNSMVSNIVVTGLCRPNT